MRDASSCLYKNHLPQIHMPNHFIQIQTASPRVTEIITKNTSSLKHPVHRDRRSDGARRRRRRRRKAQNVIGEGRPDSSPSGGRLQTRHQRVLVGKRRVKIHWGL
ncbi:hypothetical protein FKM82_023642 [Ascaphus truei]